MYQNNTGRLLLSLMLAIILCFMTACKNESVPNQDMEHEIVARIPGTSSPEIDVTDIVIKYISLGSDVKFINAQLGQQGYDIHPIAAKGAATNVIVANKKICRNNLLHVFCHEHRIILKAQNSKIVTVRSMLFLLAL